MTSEVTQAALEPCPWCGTAEHLSVQWPGSMTADMPDCRCRVVCTHIDHDTVVGPTAYGKFAATTAWNTRLTAQSGEGRSGAGEDALLVHFTRMMEAAANYVEPTTYVARHPNVDALGACKYNTEFPEPEDSHAEEAKQAIRQRRDQAFIRDMIYMLDGPEQRAALNATDDAGGA